MMLEILKSYQLHFQSCKAWKVFAVLDVIDKRSCSSQIHTALVRQAYDPLKWFCNAKNMQWYYDNIQNLAIMCTASIIIIAIQCWKFTPVCPSEADNFGVGPGTFCWIFFNFIFMIWDSRQEDLRLFWLSFKHCSHSHSLWISNSCLTHCGLVTPYGDRSGSTLAQVMAYCLMAPSHYLNQCWLIIINCELATVAGNFIFLMKKTSVPSPIDGSHHVGSVSGGEQSIWHHDRWNWARTHGCVRNDRETHETMLLDCTTGEAGSAIQ